VDKPFADERLQDENVVAPAPEPCNGEKICNRGGDEKCKLRKKIAKQRKKRIENQSKGDGGECIKYLTF
jgi:hypothetical protein